jgi:uncharacterized membrane protein
MGRDVPTFRWTCPDCQKQFRIPEGKTPPERCPTCAESADVTFAAAPEPAAPEPMAEPVFIDTAAVEKPPAPKPDPPPPKPPEKRFVEEQTAHWAVWIINVGGMIFAGMLFLSPDLSNVMALGLFLLLWLMAQSIQLSGLHAEIHALRKDLAERDRHG